MKRTFAGTILALLTAFAAVQPSGFAIPMLVGTVFAHRVFDLVPVVLLVIFVLTTADIPGWAFTSLVIVLSVGVGLFLFAFASARHHGKTRIVGMGSVRRIVVRPRNSRL